VRLLGRLLMVAGLIIVPVGLYYGMVLDRGMTLELTLLTVGVTLFLLGRGLAGGAKP
jgi:hypothetical protein